MPRHRRSRAVPPWPTARDCGSPRLWLPAVDLARSKYPFWAPFWEEKGWVFAGKTMGKA